MSDDTLKPINFTLANNFHELARRLNPVVAEIREDISSLKSALAARNSLSAASAEPPTVGEAALAEGPVAADKRGSDGQGVAEAYPRWLPANRNSYRAYDGHCHALGIKPEREQIAAKMDQLDMQHSWTKNTMATRWLCEPTEAAAWAYMGKTLGYLEFDEQRRCYKKIK